MLMMASRRSASHHWPTVQSIDATRIDTFFDPYQVQVDTQRGTHARSGADGFFRLWRATKIPSLDLEQSIELDSSVLTSRRLCTRGFSFLGL